MERVSRVYIVRHGQVEGWERLAVFGQTDVEITELGVIQMEHLAERLRLANISAIYSSDLRRSAIGARIIARPLNVPLHVMPELKELHFGDWEGLTFSEIRERFSRELDQRKADPVKFQNPGNGESIGHLSKRVIPCFKKILAEQEGNDILLVAHGMVNRVILCDALGLDLAHMFNFHQDYGCLNIIDYFADSRVVKLING